MQTSLIEKGLMDTADFHTILQECQVFYQNRYYGKKHKIKVVEKASLYAEIISLLLEDNGTRVNDNVTGLTRTQVSNMHHFNSYGRILRMYMSMGTVCSTSGKTGRRYGRIEQATDFYNFVTNQNRRLRILSLLNAYFR